ncbi:MAG: hypothetical protein MUF31_18670 [Akkermansiaceae bacterium]|jgi:hypothetical protein|nr:hypothetical protein [Akkermansiaceae bacterium]
MKPHPDHDQDPVWELLRQSPAHRPGPRFVDDTLRAARLMDATPWWKKIALPLALGSLATAATAVVIGLMFLPSSSTSPSQPGIVTAESPLDDLDELVITEAVHFAAENPGEFTDAELVSLIAY